MNEDIIAIREKNSAALSSLLAALILTVLKLGVGLYTNSLGILSEALHSGLDLLAAAMTLAAVRMASKPADQGHPYGHGKIENLSALAETLLLFGICFWVVYEGVERLMAGTSAVTPSLWAVAVMLVSIIIDCNRVRVLRKVAQKHKSQALEADALHFATDILSSAVVLVGVLAVWLAAKLELPVPVQQVLGQADTVAALLVAVIIFKASISMAFKAVNSLMDSGTPADKENIEKVVSSLPGIGEVRRVRVRTSGSRSFVDLVVTVPPKISVDDGHRLAHRAEEAIGLIMPGADVTVHVEPGIVSVGKSNPFELVRLVAGQHGLAVHNVSIQNAGGHYHLEMHVELPGSIPFVQAYAQVARFESDLQEFLPQTEIVSRVEPEEEGSQVGDPISVPMSCLVWQEIQVACEQDPLLCSAHDFSVYQLPVEGMCISFHCGIKGDLSLNEAHAVSRRIEKRLREAMPVLGRINIHLEAWSERT